MGGTLWRKRMTRGPCSVVVVIDTLELQSEIQVKATGHAMAVALLAGLEVLAGVTRLAASLAGGHARSWAVRNTRACITRTSQLAVILFTER